MNARHARKELGTKSGRKRKAGNSQKEPEAKRTRQVQQGKRDGNTIYADDSEVGMQTENIVKMQEEEDVGQEYYVQDASPRKQERAPLAESSVNLCIEPRL